MDVMKVVAAPEQRVHVFISITSLFHEVDPVYHALPALGRVTRHKVGSQTLETRSFVSFFLQTLRDIGCDVTVFTTMPRNDASQLLELLQLPRNFITVPNTAKPLSYEVLEIDATVKPDRSFIVDEKPQRWQNYLRPSIIAVEGDAHDGVNTLPTVIDFLDVTSIVRECVMRVNVYPTLSTAAALQALRSETLFSAVVFVPPALEASSRCSSLAAVMGARLTNSPDEATHVIYAPPGNDPTQTAMPPLVAPSPSSVAELVTTEWLERSFRSCVAWPAALFYPYHSSPRISLHRCFDADVSVHPKGTAEHRVACAWLLAWICTEPASVDVWVEVAFLKELWKSFGIEPNDDLVSVVFGTPKPVKNKGNFRNKLTTKMPTAVNVTSTDFMFSPCETYVAQADVTTTRPLPSQALALRKGFHCNPAYFVHVSTQTDVKTAATELAPGVTLNLGSVTKDTQTPLRHFRDSGCQTLLGPQPVYAAADSRAPPPMYPPPPPNGPPPPPPPPFVSNTAVQRLPMTNGHNPGADSSSAPAQQRRDNTVAIFAEGFDKLFYDGVWFDKLRRTDPRFADAEVQWKSDNPCDGAVLHVPPAVAQSLLNYGGRVRLQGRQFVFTPVDNAAQQRPLPQPAPPAIRPTFEINPSNGVPALRRPANSAAPSNVGPPLPPPPIPLAHDRRPTIAAAAATTKSLPAYDPYTAYQIPPQLPPQPPMMRVPEPAIDPATARRNALEASIMQAPTEVVWAQQQRPPVAPAPTPAAAPQRPVLDRATISFLRTLNISVQDLNSFAQRKRLEKICADVSVLDADRGGLLQRVLTAHLPYTD